MQDDYPWDVGRTDAERVFLRGLAARCQDDRALFDAWTSYPHLLVTLTIDDSEAPLFVRTLRVDFDGQSLVGGNDPSQQMTEEHLDPADPDYFEVAGPHPPDELAERAYQWFREQAARPVERREWWEGAERVHLEWVLADVDRPLVGNVGRRPDRPPDRIAHLKPPTP